MTQFRPAATRRRPPHLNISQLFVEPLGQVRTVLHGGDLEHLPGEQKHHH